MRIENISVKNYRTLVDCNINFPDFYSAISGKNNAGKSNLIKVVRSFFGSDDDFDPFSQDGPSVSFKQDYPLWKRRDEQKNPIEFILTIRVDKIKDEGFYKFVQTFLQLDCNDPELIIEFGTKYEEKASNAKHSLTCSGTPISDDFKIQEIHKRLRNSNAFVFHNSTQSRHPYAFAQKTNSLFGTMSTEDKEKIKESKDQLFRRLNAAAARHKQDISEMLGRLDEKYEVSISLPNFDFEDFPFRLSLGDKKDDVPLDDWGSGTQNRTHILLALLKAKKVREAGNESNRVTPIIIIEEPESFLHPSAQAEFGMILRDLAKDFEVQVITTTHSPHMLSVVRPDANILFSRRIDRHKQYETIIIDTSGTDWMTPFAMALGVTSEAFGPWRSILFADADELLLVEGDIDKDYFEDLRKNSHADKKLQLSGAIFPYGGDGFFSHDVMMKFVIDRFNKVIVTFDLDVEGKVAKKLESLGLKKNDDFFAIGINSPGKRNIEGLLPSKVTSTVAANYPEIFDHATSADDGNHSAKQKLKRLKQEAFFSSNEPLSEGYEEFYKIADQINRALKKKRKS